MGHSTATVFVTPAELAEYETNKAKDDARYGSGYGYNFRESLADKIISIAIAEWADDPDSDKGSPTGDKASIGKVEPEELTHLSYDHVGRGAHVIPLMDKRDYVIKTKTFTVKMDAVEWAQYLNFEGGVLRKKVGALAPELIDNMVSITVQRPELEGRAAWGRSKSDGWKVVSAVTADTTGGKTKNVYYIVVDGRRMPEKYDSQALAREAGTKYLNDHMDALEVKVGANVVREDANQLVLLKRNVRSATAKVTLTYTKTTKENPRTNGWVAMFDYHH